MNLHPVQGTGSFSEYNDSCTHCLRFQWVGITCSEVPSTEGYWGGSDTDESWKVLNGETPEVPGVVTIGGGKRQKKGRSDGRGVGWRRSGKSKTRTTGEMDLSKTLLGHSIPNNEGKIGCLFTPKLSIHWTIPLCYHLHSKIQSGQPVFLGILRQYKIHLNLVHLHSTTLSFTITV